MDEKPHSMSKSHSLQQYNLSIGNSGYLDKKHSKTVDKINQMRYSQYKSEQSACYPHSQLSQATNMIIRQLHNSRLFKKTISPHHQIPTMQCVNHSQIRAKATKRVFNLFLKEEIDKHEPSRKVKRISLQKNGETNPNCFSRYKKLIDDHKDCHRGNSNQLLIKKIIETRLRYNRTVKLQSNSLFAEVKDEKLPQKKKTQLRSQTENNKDNHYYRHIDLSSNAIQAKKHLISYSKPPPLIKAILDEPYRSNIHCSNGSLSKDQLATHKDIRLRDLEAFFSFFNSNNNTKN